VSPPTLANVAADPVAAGHAGHAEALARQLADLRAQNTWNGRTWYDKAEERRKVALEAQLARARAAQAEALSTAGQANQALVAAHAEEVADRRVVAAWKGRGLSLLTFVLFFFRWAFSPRTTVVHLGERRHNHVRLNLAERDVLVGDGWAPSPPPAGRRVNGHSYPPKAEAGVDWAK
jgi:hypothetical protein